MNLLITTQKVDKNDDVLGFFHSWIAEFAKHCEQLIVICLQKGECDLPANVKVLSLGKEKKKLLNGYIVKLLYIRNFYKYIWRERRNYEAVFVHMNPEYVVLGGIFWRLIGKKIGLWYTHKAVNLKLRIAKKLTNIVFTASKESFRLPSKKIKVVGHGIDVARFRVLGFGFQKNKNKFKIVTIGRISPVKDYETLIKAVDILTRERIELKVDIIGGPGLPEDEKYLFGLKKMVKAKNLEDIINFVGSVPNKNIVQYLQSADLFAHMSRTGSLDKAVLEAMAVGLPVISSNKAVLNDVFDKELKVKLGYSEGDSKVMANRIKEIMRLSLKERKIVEKKLRNIVVREHSLEELIKKIISIYNMRPEKNPL